MHDDDAFSDAAVDRGAGARVQPRDRGRATRGGGPEGGFVEAQVERFLVVVAERVVAAEGVGRGDQAYAVCHGYKAGCCAFVAEGGDEEVQEGAGACWMAVETTLDYVGCDVVETVGLLWG